MIEGLIQDIVIALNEFLNGIVVNLLSAVFWPETTMTIGLMPGIHTTMGTINFDPLFLMFQTIGLGLITLKFLKKGFEVYIGWTDGDKDNDVGHLVLNYVRAIVIVLAFNEIYRFLTNVITTLLGEALNALTAGATPYLSDAGFDIAASLFTGAFVPIVIVLILLVILIIIFFRLLIMGLQLLMLRIAFPVACVGLVDNDKGIFKSFFQKFIMLSVSAFAMIFFFRFSLLLVMNNNPFWALAAGMASLKTPDILRDFMMGYGGAGLGGRAMSSVHTMLMIRNSVGRIGSKLPIPIK